MKLSTENNSFSSIDRTFDFDVVKVVSVEPKLIKDFEGVIQPAVAIWL